MLDDMKRDIEMLKESNRAIAKEIFKLQDRVQGLDEKMTSGFREVLGKLDVFANEADLSRRERKLQETSFNFLHERLINHEARIVRVERIEGIQGT